MTIRELEKRLEEEHYDLRALNISKCANYDERFNLLIRDDGNWEIFYGEHGQKTNPRVFDNEEEAADAFYEIVRTNISKSLFPKRKRPDELTIFERFDGAINAGRDKITLGLILFCLLLGVFFTIVMLAVQAIDVWFFLWIVWVVIFSILTVIWVKKVHTK
ncbi:MAG: hypothetical protein J5636_05925 [Clostridiales bacterium]|nr:hypothetical protein [Clostridiales bacterium]